MVLNGVDLGAINSFAVRVVHLSECVTEAHRAGHGPGQHGRPWELDFQRRAVSVYADTYPPAYLRGVSDASRRTAKLMSEVEVEEPTAADWDIMARFLRSTASALAENPEISAITPEIGRSSIASTATGLLRYERFAELLHPHGADRLRDAASAVARHCQARLSVTPTAQEIEWIISVAVNEPIEQLAERSHMSTRGAYHRLEALWKRLGVSTPVQGVALAVQQGWIMPPPYDQHMIDNPKNLHT